MSEAACSDLRPPPSRSAMATRPSRVHQNTRWAAGGSSFPPADIISTTRDAESDEVMKKMIRRTTLTKERRLVRGRPSSIL